MLWSSLVSSGLVWYAKNFSLVYLGGSPPDKKYFAASLTEVLDLVNCMNGILFQQCVNGERCLFLCICVFPISKKENQNSLRVVIV